ncbi:MAG: hypothetical protein WCA44_17850, partial [Acidobacteriaceae bacterium]
MKLSRLLVSVCVAAGLASAASAQTMVTLTASKLTDAAGNKVTGSFCVTPENGSGTPIGFTFGGGGQSTQTSTCAPVSAGALSMQAPDTAATQPQNVCLAAQLINPSAPASQRVARTWPCLQPASTGQSSWCTTVSGSTTCNLDNYVAASAPLAPVTAPTISSVTATTLSAGSSATASVTPLGSAAFAISLGIPTGATGATGATGPAGSVSAASSFEGQAFADELQSPPNTGNNGIAQALSACASLPYSCQIAAPALYAATEAQPWGGARQWEGAAQNANVVNGPASGQPTGCVEDARFGAPEWICNGAVTPPSWAGNGAGSTPPVQGPSFTTYNTQNINAGYYPAPPALTLNAYNFAGTEYNRFQSQFPALLVTQSTDALTSSQGLEIFQ